MKKILCLLLLFGLLLCGCTEQQPVEQKQYTATFLDLFDTVTTVMGMADSEAEFTACAQAIHDELLRYHQLFDIYNEYPDIHNLKTVNDRAGQSPVQVAPEVIALLKDCKAYFTLTKGKVNAAMGSVLSLWHQARNDGIRDPMNAKLPAAQALENAALHRDFASVLLDEAASTVYITDSQTQLDVGAIAKGWATQKVAESAPSGMLISVGGNVCATGPKTADGTRWVIGIQDPDSDGNLHTIYLSKGSVVTSGDYQRSYTVAGERYHHIIDPDTCMPATYWRSVTVVCSDSGLADALSTALFLLPREEGEALLARCGAEALWLDHSGTEFMTPGFREMLRT